MKGVSGFGVEGLGVGVLVGGVNFWFFTTFRKSFAMRVYSSKGNLRTKRKITSDSPRCEKVARLLPALTSLKTPKILWHPSRWHPIQPHPVRGLLPTVVGWTASWSALGVSRVKKSRFSRLPAPALPARPSVLILISKSARFLDKLLLF